MGSDLNLGKIAYEAYCIGAGVSGTTDGKPIPKFNTLQRETQLGWIAAAKAVLKSSNKA